MEDLGIVGISHVAWGRESVGLVLSTRPALFEWVLVRQSVEFIVSVDSPVEDMAVATSRQDLLVAVEFIA